MNASLPAPMRADIMGLAQAMRQSSALDAVPLNLTEAQWQGLADFLQPVSLQQGQVLIEQGVKDRTVYFVALELSVAMAAVLARRMYNRPKRVAVT